KNRIREMEEEFYSQTMSVHVTTTDIGLVARSFNVEENVCDLVDATVHIEKGIKDNEARIKYFRMFLNDLADEERELLINKYIKIIPTLCDDVEEKAIKEIREIETMINLMNGYPEELRKVKKEE